MTDSMHFHRRELVKSINDKFDSENPNNLNFRKKILILLKSYYQRYYKDISVKFHKDKNGIETAAFLSKLSDIIILSTYDAIIKYSFPQPNPTTSDKLSILAVGGYGRNHLSPGSDIDLLILTPYKLIPRTEQIVESLLYILWDMKLKVGYSVRNISDTIAKAKLDNTICTSLLDARFIAGDPQLWKEISENFKNKIIKNDRKKFFYEKLNERDQRHKRMGDTQYLLEPNIKEGKGGLRDIHVIKWIIQFLYGTRDYRKFIEHKIVNTLDSKLLIDTENFLINLRTIMHFTNDSHSDRLTFDLQAEAAKFFGFKDKNGLRASEILMKQYYLKIRSISYLNKKIIENIELKEFKSEKSYLNKLLQNFKSNKKGIFELSDDKIFIKKNVTKLSALNILEAFHMMIDNNLNFSSELYSSIQDNLNQIDKVRGNKKANKFFIDIILCKKNSDKILRTMNETGVLGRFIPDFGKVVAQIQHDMYHVFTVDEHTLNAIGIVRKLYNKELNTEFAYLTQIAEKIVSKKVLIISIFLHDIAKGRGGDHSIIGSKVAQKLCPRFGLKSEEVETVSWLVKYHLLMSNIAFKRDINDEETLNNFCDEVQSVERLRLLYVLTVIDINAVGPNIWNEWKNNLLTNLYEEALMLINGGSESQSRKIRIDNAKEILRKNMKTWDDKKLKKYINRFYSYYWTNLEPEVQERHAYFINKADDANENFSLNFYPIKKRNITEVSIYVQDHHGLFSRMCAGLALAGTSILDGRIVTTKDGMAINTFLINAFDLSDSNRFEAFKSTIYKSVFEERTPKEIIKDLKNINSTSRKDIIKIEPRVLLDNFSSNTHTIVEINARDRVGLLSILTTEIFNMGLQISTARISTYGLRAVDVFYIRDITGMKITDAKKIKYLKERLIFLIDEDRSNEQNGIKKYKIAQ